MTRDPRTDEERVAEIARLRAELAKPISAAHAAAMREADRRSAQLIMASARDEAERELSAAPVLHIDELLVKAARLAGKELAKSASRSRNSKRSKPGAVVRFEVQTEGLRAAAATSRKQALRKRDMPPAPAGFSAVTGTRLWVGGTPIFVYEKGSEGAIYLAIEIETGAPVRIEAKAVRFDLEPALLAPCLLLARGMTREHVNALNGVEARIVSSKPK